MAAQHTPGPWTADDGDGRYFGVAGDDGEMVAYLVEPQEPMRVNLLPYDPEGGPDGYRFWERHKANARLIAAAPEMLEALESINRMASPGHRTLDDMIRDFGFIVDRARAAIAKATRGA
jgi:hypothetical protein